MSDCIRVRSNRPPGLRPPASSGRSERGAWSRAELIWAVAQGSSGPLSQLGTGEAKPSLSRLSQTSLGRPRALAASRRILFLHDRRSLAAADPSCT